MKQFYDIVSAIINEKEYEKENPKIEEMAIQYINKLDREAKKLNTGLRFENFSNTLDEYIAKKDTMSEKKKERYLKFLFALSKIYDINLRMELENYVSTKKVPKKKDFYQELDYYLSKKTKMKEKEKKEVLTRLVLLAQEQDIDIKMELKKKKKPSLFESYTSPLENKKFLKALLYERYMNCRFDIEEIILPKEKEPKESTSYFTEEHKKEFQIDTEKEFSYIIYLNTGNREETYQFLKEYEKKCKEKELDYSMEPYEEKAFSCTHTYLFASEEDSKEKLKIIETIGRKHPNWIETFGSPAAFSAIKKGSYFGISSIGLKNKEKEVVEKYAEVFQDICEIAYYRVLSKLAITKIVAEEEHKKIQDFIYLKNIYLPENAQVFETTFNKATLKQIKDIVNKTLPNIKNTLQIYMESEKIDTLILEFKKSILYITNLLCKKEKHSKNNIAILWNFTE